jgi:asparagine synthase (glutamine-hydrolysing)
VIVLKAYIAFGNSVFADLVGEFALTLWCRRTKSLLFARSSCGARTLYYVINKNQLTWSSDFAHLVRVTGVDLTVNDAYVIDYMVSQPDTKTTPLVNVQSIPQNCVVEFSNGHFAQKRELWNPTCVSALSYRTDQEYEDHLRDALKEAVRVRLRSKRTIFAELSGGLDSSTIVLMADEVLRSQNRPPGDLQTTSCGYERSKSCDETPYIRAVEEKRGIETHLVHESDQDITLGLNDPEFTGLPNALHCFPGRYRTVAALMRQHGARLLLTGRGGDHLFWSESDGRPIVADQIRAGHLFRAHGECLGWSHAASIPYFELLVKGALPLTLDSWFPGRRKRPTLPAWLHPRFQQRIAAITPSFIGYEGWHAAPSKGAQVFFLEHMFRYLGAGFLQEYTELYVSHPYSHRPLVEFCLGTPVSQFLRNGETRSLMRRTFKDLLPYKTVRRRSKGMIDELITRAWQKEWSAVADIGNWQVCQRKYATVAGLAEAVDQVGHGILDLTGPLLRLFSVERWLRSLSHARTDKPYRQSSLISVGGLFSAH